MLGCPLVANRSIVKKLLNKIADQLDEWRFNTSIAKVVTEKLCRIWSTSKYAMPYSVRYSVLYSALAIL